MAFEFLGGSVHCGRPWHRYGVAYALVDCPDHDIANGNGAVAGELPAQRHADRQPRSDRLAHLQGLAGSGLAHPRGHVLEVARAVVARRPADPGEPARREQQAVRDLPDQAQLVQRHGRACGCRPATCARWSATSTPSTAARAGLLPDRHRSRSRPGRSSTAAGWPSSWASRPACLRLHRSIDNPSAPRPDRRPARRGLRPRRSPDGAGQQVRQRAGRRRRRLRRDRRRSSTARNFLETGTFWDMRSCEAAEGVHDKTQLTALPGDFRRRTSCSARSSRPVRRSASRRCRSIRRGPHVQQPRPDRARRAHDPPAMTKRHDLRPRPHERQGAQESMDLIEEPKYSGVVSSHSWATPDAYPRIYKLGGFITPYAGDSSGFVSNGSATSRWVDPRFYWAIGFGADINGFGAQGDPRGADVPNPVTYPFTGLGGVRRSTSRSAASGPTTSTPTASRTTASTPTGSRTCAAKAARDRRGHGARLGGLPADVGAGRSVSATMAAGRRRCARAPAPSSASRRVRP